MKARGPLVCLICVAVAALALPAATSAKAGGDKGSNLFQLHVDLPDSNGYSMEISAEDHRHVELRVSKGAVAVSYSVLGRASSRRVDADFGTLGEAHLRLHLKPELVVPLSPGKKRCGERIGFYGGRFGGNVDFAGEPGVAGVHAHRGHAFLLHFNHVCKHRHRRPARSGLARRIEGEAPQAALLDQLSAELTAEGRTISFEALRFKGSLGEISSPTFVLADLTERLGRVVIDRSAFEITPKKVLRVSRRGKQPETAAITLSKPFAGSASYSAAPGAASSWSGDLSVSLPGAGTVPLTGTGFSAELCRAYSEAEAENCP